jgi:HAD superfamily hydrolase (TIGR01549 family)
VVKVALFDLDNTLVDRSAAFARWAHDFVVERGLDPSAVPVLCELDRDGFASRHALFSEARRRLELGDDVERLISDYRSRYPEYFAPDGAVQDALGLLRDDGWRIGVVTNGPPTQRHKIDRAGLSPLVDVVVISDEFGVAKPDRAIFEEALRRCGVDGAMADHAWMLGDTPGPDIGGGRAVGLRTAWFHRGRAWPEHHYYPDAVVGDVGEAVRLLRAADPS